MLPPLNEGHTYDYLSVVTNQIQPTYCADKYTQHGLYHGAICTNIAPQTDEFRIATSGRGICDAFGGFVIQKDDMATAYLNHFYSTTGYRRGHSALLEGIGQDQTEDAARIGVLLITKPVNRCSTEYEFENLIKQAYSFAGRHLIVVAVNLDIVTLHRQPSEVVLTCRIENGVHVYGIEVTGTQIKKEFTYQSLQEKQPEAPLIFDL